MGAHTAQRCSSTVLAKLMNASMQTLSLSHISVNEKHASHPYKLTGKEIPQTTGILHILIFKEVLIKFGFTVSVIRS